MFKRVLQVLLLLQLTTSPLWAQSSLQGKILDENHQPLPGATVTIDKTFLGAVANEEGAFQFSSLKEGSYTLKASFVGYESKKQVVKIPAETKITFLLKRKPFLTDEVVVSGTRVSKRTPMAYSEVTASELKENNIAQDIPFLLSLTPSLVASSESGNGIGNTAMRIRGSDPTRINVTVNGIPVNDSESQGVYWVNMPDFSSSVSNVQIQRGVGTSSNGAASFGGTVNFETFAADKKPYGEISSAAGSFNTFKNSLKVGTGLMDNQFSLDARISKVKSDGYIDRAFSDHESAYLSGAWHGEKSLLRANLIYGDQTTGISWWGTPKELLETNRTYNPAGEYEDADGNIHYYKDQTDNYKQVHYQLIFTHQFNSKWDLHSALHYTRGDGYYEQYKEDETYKEYNLEPVKVGETTITETDLIRRKHMGNDFYGAVASLNYHSSILDATFGGGWNQYNGDHWGNIIWMTYAGNTPKNHQWYFNKGEKTDFNLYGKASLQLTDKLSLFGDLQYRYIYYLMSGQDDDLNDLAQSHTYHFFNPKGGIYYNIAANQEAYLSFAMAHREPTRTNFKDATGDPNATPNREVLYDTEMGYSFKTPKVAIGANLFYMYYRDQLVPTGEKSSVGYDIMTNVDKSYRAGIELQGAYRFNSILEMLGNLSLSRNKIKNFVDHATWSYKDDTKEDRSQNLGTTDLAYSPNITANLQLVLHPVKGMNLGLNNRYVGKQYFDNTSSADRQIDAYLVSDLICSYSLPQAVFKNIQLQFFVNNLFNIEYENNAYGGHYYYEDQEGTWSYYYPQAGRNFMASLTLNF